MTTLVAEQNSGNPVMITEVSPQIAETPVFAAQFKRVMEQAASLDHPAILPVLDFGIRGGVPFIVQPYVARGSLASALGLRRAYTLHEVIDMIAQIAAAVDFAHRQDCLHGGVTLQNIWRGADGGVMLGGFGLAELIQQAIGLTEETLPYAAPELLLKAPYSIKIDTYALGILGYQLITGRLPFTGSSMTQMMQGRLRRSLPPFGDELASVPVAAHEALRRAASSVSHARYDQAIDLANDLARAAGVPTLALFQLSRSDRLSRQVLTRYRSLPTVSPKQAPKVKVSDMYVEALSQEQASPTRARQLYQQILNHWPRMAQGDVLDRLVRLEHDALASYLPTMISRARRALNRGDWALLLQLSKQALEVNADHAEAAQMARTAATMIAAEEHDQAAALADDWGDTVSAVTLTRELYRAVPNFPDRAGLTVINPRRARFVRESQALSAHASNILALDFSKDGRLLASGSTDKTARIVWLPRLETSAALDAFHSWVCALAFSPGGEYLLTGLWDGEIRLWALPDGEYRGMIAGLFNQIQALAFAHHQPDLIAIAAGNFVTLWRVPSGERVGTVREADLHSISALGFSPTSAQLICGTTHGALRIRDMADPRYPLVKEIPVHASTVHALACLPDGERVVSLSQYGGARMVDLRRGLTLWQFNGHDGPILDVACSAQQALIVTGGADKTVRLWDADTGESLAALTGHDAPVTCVRVSPDDRAIASADSAGNIRLWSVR